eukprot:NODE_50_length_31184_cov_0.705099.p5 type:complete len:487 gc:universal NODE_50_length_31184_cov_0.705099:28145-29605(+)
MWTRFLLQRKPIRAHLSQKFDVPNARRFNFKNLFGGQRNYGTKQYPIHVIQQEQHSWKSVFLSLTKFGLSAFVLISLAGIILDQYGMSKQFEFTVHEADVPKEKFDSVEGCDEAKEALMEIVEFLKFPDKFLSLGAKLPRGILLQGSPGTGKTLLAKALAGESNVPFYFMSGSEFDEIYVGVGAKRVRELFSTAKKNGPAIVFIDELDAVGGKRNPRDQSYMRQTVNQLLVELDGFKPSDNVVVIAATNSPEMLDKALLRPGRFDKIVDVPLPDVRGRESILKVHSKGIKTDFGIDYKLLAKTTPGFSGADLMNMTNQAAIIAARNGSQTISIKDFEQAKDEIIMGSERKSAFISPENKKLTAYHEAGHAIAAYFTSGALPLHKASIIPRGRSLGVTVQVPDDDKLNYTKKEYFAMLDVCFGGRIAEEIVAGPENVTSGAYSDFQKATKIARQMVLEMGMSKVISIYLGRDQSLFGRRPFENFICN